jgi:hypothetical protein
MDAASSLVPTVPATTTPDPTQVVGTPFGLSNHDYSHFNNYYSFSNNSKIAMTVLPTLDETIRMALSYTLPLMMAAASSFIPGVLTSPPIDPMVSLSRRLHFQIIRVAIIII